jgi:hypothetical protein
LRIRAFYRLAPLSCLILFSSFVIARNTASPQSSSNPNKHDYALIYGTIWGPEGQPVPGVPIKIRRASDKKPKWELVSNSTGEFAQRVPAGTEDYAVEADIKMPKGQAKPQVTVHIDNDERQDIGIHLTQEELPHR